MVSNRTLASGLSTNLDQEQLAACPHCGGITGHKVIANPTNVDQNTAGNNAFAIVRCNVCGGQTAVLLRTTGFGASGLGTYNVIAIFPHRDASARAIPHAPALVQDAVREADGCASIGAPIAGVLVCRMALQAICRDRGVPEGNLKSELKALGLPDDLREIADALRVIGNETTHPSRGAMTQAVKQQGEANAWERIQAGELPQLIGLTLEIADYIYERPARAAEIRARAPLDR